jgi:hypothetical protein
LHREGIYSSHLTNWRAQLKREGAAGLAGKRPGPKPQRDDKDRVIEKQERQIARLEKELRISQALIEMQKKESEGGTISYEWSGNDWTPLTGQVHNYGVWVTTGNISWCSTGVSSLGYFVPQVGESYRIAATMRTSSGQTRKVRIDHSAHFP